MKTTITVLSGATPTQAASVDTILRPLENVKTLLCSVVGIVGMIMVVIEIMHLSSAIKQQDTSGVKMSILGLAGGAIMALIGTVLVFVMG